MNGKVTFFFLAFLYLMIGVGVGCMMIPGFVFGNVSIGDAVGYFLAAVFLWPAILVALLVTT